MTSIYGVDSNCSWYLSGGFSGCIFWVEEVGVWKGPPVSWVLARKRILASLLEQDYVFIFVFNAT
jgi:hypothetical protein